MTVLRYQDHRERIAIWPSNAFEGWTMVGYMVPRFHEPSFRVILHHWASKAYAEEMATRLQNGEDYKDVLKDINARK